MIADQVRYEPIRLGRSGSRDAVEAAINSAKSGTETTWEVAAKKYRELIVPWQGSADFRKSQEEREPERSGTS